jgi:hypothetical protein
MASSSKKIVQQYINKVALTRLPTLWLDSRIWEVDLNDKENKYSYSFNIFIPEKEGKVPIGVVYHKEQFHQFFHSTATGNPYLEPVCKEANCYELFEDDSSEPTDDEQLALQICNSVVQVSLGQLGSPETTCTPWGPTSIPTITPTTYTTQLTQSGLPMATETITRTLMNKGTTSQTLTHELSGPAEGSVATHYFIKVARTTLGLSWR